MSQPRSILKFASLGVLAAALLAPLPALARDSAHSSDAQRGLAEVEGRLSDPAAQQAIGDAMASLMAAMLDIKAAPFLKAVDRAGATMGDRPVHREIPDDATLGDLAGPGARDMPREVSRRAPAMMSAAGAMVGAMSEMLPQLEQMGRRMEQQMRRSLPRGQD
ncbi:MAG: hypothetical protein JSR96_06445 [Proteobacteria bacterium]|nr:hypothetical protein [Pseudomonadota bacterium]